MKKIIKKYFEIGDAVMDFISNNYQGIVEGLVVGTVVFVEGVLYGIWNALFIIAMLALLFVLKEAGR